MLCLQVAYMARESHCTLCFTGLSQTKDKAVRTALLHARPEDMRVGVVFIYEDDPRTERVRQDIKALVGAVIIHHEPVVTTVPAHSVQARAGRLVTVSSDDDCCSFN